MNSGEISNVRMTQNFETRARSTKALAIDRPSKRKSLNGKLIVEDATTPYLVVDGKKIADCCASFSETSVPIRNQKGSAAKSRRREDVSMDDGGKNESSLNRPRWKHADQTRRTGNVGGGSGGAGRPLAGTEAERPASKDPKRVVGTSANVDLVHAAVLNFESGLRRFGPRSSDTMNDDVTSTRGQNVSILQLHGPSESWDPPITAFTDTGGSLRSAPRTCSLKTEKTLFANGKKLKQHSLDSYSSGTLTKRQKWDSNSNSKSLSVFTSSGLVGSPAILNSSARELSPVRWCDREVDGVYLGRSGWVQVQQRSLDENKRPIVGKDADAVSTLPNRIKLADRHFDSESRAPSFSGGERKELHRPAYLPLPMRKHGFRENLGTPPPFTLREFDRASPPSVTPIISPPPAFKDSGLETVFETRSPRRTLSGKPPRLPRSKAAVDCESPPESPPEGPTTRDASSSRFGKSTTSLVSTRPQLPRIGQTQSLEDNSFRRMHFTRRRDSDFASSPFGFRSLDGALGKRSSTILKINESESCGNDAPGKEENEENHGSFHLGTKSPPPEIPNPGGVSPVDSVRGSLSHRRYGRRSPALDSTGVKNYARRSPSSESNSSSGSGSGSSTGRQRKSPNAGFRRLGSRQARQPSLNSFGWDGRNSKVRRSRSLQLSEKRSPNALSSMTPSVSGKPWCQVSPDYFVRQLKNGFPQQSVQLNMGERRPVTVNGEPASEENPRRYLQSATRSESVFLREVEEEARIVSEFLSGTRSRAAARNLLMHRYLNRQESDDQEKSGDDAPSSETADYAVNFLYGNRTFQKKARQRSGTRSANGGNFPDGNSCDSAGRDCSRSRRGSPVLLAKTSPPTLPRNSSSSAASVRGSTNSKSSQSYPSQRKRDESEKKENGGGESARSSPVSPESVDGFDSKKHLRKIEAWNDGCRFPGSADPGSSGSRNVEQEKRRPGFRKQNCEKIGNKFKFDNSSANGFGIRARAGVRTSADAEREREKEQESHRGRSTREDRCSSASSSSSDIWIAASGTKSSKTRKSSTGASSPAEENANSARSPAAYRDSDSDQLPERTASSRPGSAPADDEDRATADAQQRSLSLPESFTSERHGFNTGKPQSNLFPWKRRFVGSSSTGVAICQRPLTPEVSRTAPATPIRDLAIAKEKDKFKKVECRRSSSIPLLDEPVPPTSEWTAASRVTSEETESFRSHLRTENNACTSKDTQSPRTQVTSSESVLQKFKKSFSLKFAKAGKGTGKDDQENAENLLESTNEEDSQAAESTRKPTSQTFKEDISVTDQKFRFGPLVWRSSKERKRGKKVSRNAKCNSGDSGIQVENAGNLAGESSESHDTDQHEDVDSPPLLRRRFPRGTEKSSRPQSEVINQILIDKFKADLQWRAQTKGYSNGKAVRRTNSDLGGQRLFNWDMRNNYRRMISTSSPIKGRRIGDGSRKPAPEDLTAFRNNKRILGRVRIRRSMSQPLGLDELSPLMRRRPSAVRSQTLSEDERDMRTGTSEDEAVSDSGSSIASSNDRKKSFELAMEEEIVILAEAVWDHVAMEPDELPFRAGDVIEVLDTCDRDWWWGTTGGDNCGYFPSAFVRLRVSQEDTVEDCLAAMASGKPTSSQSRRRTSISLLSNDQVRSSVVRELLNTERDFVKILRDVTEGYVTECRKRTDMFSPAQIKTIFSNLEDLLAFQTEFLVDLEKRVDSEFPHKSCLGDIFLMHRSGFRMYSEYCNSHPMAVATLQELYQRNSYSKFFEGCRLVRGLIEIPLDGYLLTPVQRICKYPLQLAELLKYTRSDHPDHEKIREALHAMKGVATLINERKRKMESLEKLAAWQQRVEGWEGDDLIEISSQLIHQGEAARITSGMWTSNITLFLFDHQIIYCKKDLLKRNTYVYKGRIGLDTTEVIDFPDGKDQQLGVTIRHGIKICSCHKDKWLLFCCKSNEDKIRWLEALMQERKLVAQDKQDGLELPSAARQLARMAATRSKRRPPGKPRSKSHKLEPQHGSVNARTNRADACGVKMSRRVGTWFTFGGGKKGTQRLNARARTSSQQMT